MTPMVLKVGHEKDDQKKRIWNFFLFKVSKGWQPKRSGYPFGNWEVRDCGIPSGSTLSLLGRDHMSLGWLWGHIVPPGIGLSDRVVLEISQKRVPLGIRVFTGNTFSRAASKGL